jgi:XapX domain-containing protein
MKELLISFVIGTVVGILYGVIKVKSPAPPIIALVGLLGMVIGEQGGAWLLAKKVRAANMASTHVASIRKDPQ